MQSTEPGKGASNTGGPGGRGSDGAIAFGDDARVVNLEDT